MFLIPKRGDIVRFGSLLSGENHITGHFYFLADFARCFSQHLRVEYPENIIFKKSTTPH
jgi:hypothetical protein